MRTYSIRSAQKWMRVKPRGRVRGQAVVEMALVSMVLIFLTMGLIQYGLIYNTQVTLENITRDTARFAAVHGAESSFMVGTTTYTTGTSNLPDDGIAAYAKLVAKGTSVLPADITITVADAAGNTSSDSPLSAKRTGGQPITVTIWYPMYKKIFDWGLPGLGRFRSPQTVPNQVTMLIEGQ